MRCGDDVNTLIHGLYRDLLDPNRNQPLPHHYFLDHAILSARNKEVNKINSTILDYIHGEQLTYLSADLVTDKEYKYIPEEMLHTLEPSGFPLYKLEVKPGIPLMLLHNLGPIHVLYNGTHLKLLRSIYHVLECQILHGDNDDANADNNIVLILHMALDANAEDSPVPLC
ncbi:hypothetical protein ID866_10626 [Astraeus odoratus]|nr:hypothetical protein ID866_10626 [Astraeus odoratus]